jgi:TatD DNase family protein
MGEVELSMSVTWVDSHCHLNLIDLAMYGDDMHQLIHATLNQRVKYMLCPSVDLDTMPAVLALSEEFDSVYAAVGIHPSEVHTPLDKEQFERYAGDKKIIAVGETGLDYYHSKDQIQTQQRFFKEQIDFAKAFHKPLIIHSRDAFEDTVRILKETNAGSVGGVLHCFTGDLATAKQFIDMGFCIGISGVVTFNNARSLHQIVKALPLESLLIETDAPWLAPHPYRGKMNTPVYIPLIGDKVAALKNISTEEVAVQTTRNFFKLFFRHEIAVE